MEIEIFFSSTESGCSWYVWTGSAAQAYFFTSLDNALRFARSLAKAHRPVFISPQRSIEQAATLI